MQTAFARNDPRANPMNTQEPTMANPLDASYTDISASPPPAASSVDHHASGTTPRPSALEPAGPASLVEAHPLASLTRRQFLTASAATLAMLAIPLSPEHVLTPETLARPDYAEAIPTAPRIVQFGQAFHMEPAAAEWLKADKELTDSIMDRMEAQVLEAGYGAGYEPATEPKWYIVPPGAQPDPLSQNWLYGVKQGFREPHG